MESIYTDGEYLETTESWHSEDSPWKARQILKLIKNNSLDPKTIAEIGCGAGVILKELSESERLGSADFQGFDISPQAIGMCQKITSDRVKFTCVDLLSEEFASMKFDILLVIDVFEHVPDYMGFVEKCRPKADYKIFHIPLDLHVSSVARNSFIDNRYTIGHLHYFSEQSALATLKDAGHEIIDSILTDGAIGLSSQRRSFKRSLANVPRRILSILSTSLAARVLGGYSLLVLTK